MGFISLRFSALPLIVLALACNPSDSGGGAGGANSGGNAGASSGGNAGAGASGGSAGTSGFVGSCTEATPETVCVDYYEGYTLADTQTWCAQTSDIYSSEPCATVNASWNKIPGKCEIIDSVTNPSGARSVASYYTPGFNESSAHSHCDAYQQIAGYSSQWIPD